jgi:oligoribonuclease (3'-5' exoribonuclease)
MPDTAPGRLAVIDIETTGLNPDTDLILEIGVVIVDSALREVAHRAVLVATPAALRWALAVARSRGSDGAALTLVERMHLDNGLIHDLLVDRHPPSSDPDALSRTDSYSDAAAIITGALDDFGVNVPVPMVGSSVRSLDAPFLQRHTPELAARFTHRTIDASALTEFARFIDPKGQDAILSAIAEPDHRTIGDCRRSLQILRTFAEHYGIGPVSGLRCWPVDGLDKVPREPDRS